MAGDIMPIPEWRWSWLYRGISRVHELCFIGLLSYFEAFCKDHFASLINLEPSLVSNLKSSGHNVDLEATRVLLYAKDLNSRIGFLLGMPGRS